MADMENNTIPTEGADNTEQTGKSNNKTFTQEEVNEIVKSRLARERKTMNTGDDQEQALHDREMSLLERETLFDRGLPKELAGMIKFTDEKDLNGKLDILDNLLSSNKKEPDSQASGFRQIGVGKTNTAAGVDPVRRAMGLK